jgi:hypothetical protein
MAVVPAAEAMSRLSWLYLADSFYGRASDKALFVGARLVRVMSFSRRMIVNLFKSKNSEHEVESIICRSWLS